MPDHDDRSENPENRIMEREASGSSLIGYALIKYSAIVIIVVAVLYFLAVYVLPMLQPAAAIAWPQEDASWVSALGLGAPAT